MKICVTCGVEFKPEKANFVSCNSCREKRRKRKADEKERRERLLEQCQANCFCCPFPDCYVNGELPRKYRTI